MTKDYGPHVERHARRITEADYTVVWPFGPNEGILRCQTRNGHRVITFEVSGVTYALNRPARERGFAKIHPILLTDHAGLPYDYSPMLRLGLTLCRR